MIFGVLAPAVLSALLLVAARPVQAQTGRDIYRFKNSPDGSDPQSSLTSFEANFYGTTAGGGVFGDGTVFELSADGGGDWHETVLYSFPGGADGSSPRSSVVFDSVGNLYGTTYFGGDTRCGLGDGCGVVFKLSPVGGSWKETVLHKFNGGSDGANPLNNLIIDPAGNLYGTTDPFGNGADSRIATVFEVSPSGGHWTTRVIYSVPRTGFAGLTMDADGNIFGASSHTVFELSPDGNGGWNSTLIHQFTQNGEFGNFSTPVLDQKGNLYGTTFGGGIYNYGTVYKLSPIEKGEKKGEWRSRNLYSFKGPSLDDGYYPETGVVLDAAGNIYGTTIPNVFELVAPVGKGNYTYEEKILWTFTDRDGYQTMASPILGTTGKLYGTTTEGGTRCRPDGCGVVFEVTP